MSLTLHLSGHDAQAIHAALLHTRREYLDLKERDTINMFTKLLAEHERIPCKQIVRAFERRGKEVSEVVTTTTTVTTNVAKSIKR
jgi:hypothetical protein